MSRAAEQKIQRRATAAFIAANPVLLTLVPVNKVKSGTGWTTSDGTPRDPQYLRLIDQSSEVVGNQPGRLRSSDGSEQKATHQLLGMYDAVFAKGDYWTDENGLRYEIDEILPDNGYERRAKVTRYGI